MKKWITLVLALALALGLSACEKAAPATETTPATGEEEIVGPGGINPWVEYDSLAKVNEKIGGCLTAPDGAAVEDKYLAVMNDGECGEYRFVMDGLEYHFRFASGTTEDISGVWVEGGTVFDHEYPGGTEVVATDTMKLARWMNIDGQYVLSVEDDGKLAEADFQKTAEDLAALTGENLVNRNSDGE